MSQMPAFKPGRFDPISDQNCPSGRRSTIWHHRRMPRLLIVHHSPTRSLQALTDAVVAGAHDDAIEGVEVTVLEALAFARGEADHQDLLDADGYVLGTTANFGYMSGAMKHVFDSTFLQIGGALSDDGSGQESGGCDVAAAVRALRARSLRHHRRGPVGAVDHRRARLEAGVRRARGDGRRAGRGHRVGVRARRYDRGVARRVTRVSGPARPSSPIEENVPVLRRTPLGRGGACRARGRAGDGARARRVLGAAAAGDRRRQDQPPEARRLLRADAEGHRAASNTSEPVACSKPHTSETFAIGTLPASTGKDYDSAAHGKWIFPTCEKAFEKFLGVDESLAMRVQLSWAWFRPSERGWDKGARWYRCDLVGGPADATSYADLPDHRQGTVPRQAARGVAHLRAGTERAEVEEGGVQREARLARGDHDQARRARRTPTRATGSCRCARVTTARTPWERG